MTAETIAMTVLMMIMVSILRLVVLRSFIIKRSRLCAKYSLPFDHLLRLHADSPSAQGCCGWSDLASQDILRNSTLMRLCLLCR